MKPVNVANLVDDGIQEGSDLKMTGYFYPGEDGGILLRKLVHTEIFSALNVESFFRKKKMDISNIFVPNTDCRYIQSSFGSKIRKISIPLYIPVLLLKWGIRWFTFHGHVFCNVTY